MEMTQLVTFLIDRMNWIFPEAMRNQPIIQIMIFGYIGYVLLRIADGFLFIIPRMLGNVLKGWKRNEKTHKED